MVSAEKALKNSELEKLIRPLAVARTAFDYGFKDVEQMLLSISDGRCCIKPAATAGRLTS